MNYDDIINTEWPPQNKLQRMPLSQRAKIFLPFAALKGYEESLENVSREAEEAFIAKPGIIFNEEGEYEEL